MVFEVIVETSFGTRGTDVADAARGWWKLSATGMIPAVPPAACPVAHQSPTSPRPTSQ